MSAESIPGSDPIPLDPGDYLAFGAYVVILCAIGLWSGKQRRSTSDEYFLAGRTLPWYVVGSSFVASNISTEHFVGMIGTAFIYGICVAMYEWGNIFSFSLMIWFFIPFLLASKVFTMPEFLERRFNAVLRQAFAIATVIGNVVVFLAAALYGGGLVLESLFGWNLWAAIIILGVVSGSWAIYGGLRSVAWTDFLTVIVMIAGGLVVTVLGLLMLAGEEPSLFSGWNVMMERNEAREGIWAEVVARNAQNMSHMDDYNRLSVVQPVTHPLTPWLGLLGLFVSVSIWYNVINQFMIQRLLGARSLYDARMGIVLAGYMKIFLPLIIVVPGLILFASRPEVLQLAWDKVPQEADKGYARMLQTLLPAGLRGVFLAALFGAVQSTVNSVLNSTATVITLDIYKRHFRPQASEKTLVRVGIRSSVVVLAVSILLAGWIVWLKTSLFKYVQTGYAFLAPPFAAVFLLGLLWRRINAQGAVAAVFLGFAFALAVKLYVELPDHPLWLEPFAMQATVTWVFCVLVTIGVSLTTSPPPSQKTEKELTLNWKTLNLTGDLGRHWYSHVLLWWAIFAAVVVGLVLWLSGPLPAAPS